MTNSQQGMSNFQGERRCRAVLFVAVSTLVDEGPVNDQQPTRNVQFPRGEELPRGALPGGLDTREEDGDQFVGFVDEGVNHGSRLDHVRPPNHLEPDLRLTQLLQRHLEFVHKISS